MFLRLVLGDLGGWGSEQSGRDGRVEEYGDEEGESRRFDRGEGNSLHHQRYFLFPLCYKRSSTLTTTTTPALQRLPLRLQRHSRPIRPHGLAAYPDQPGEQE